MFAAATAFIKTLFNALNNLALSLNHIAVVARETAEAYEDEARVNRLKQLAILNKDLAPTTIKAIKP